MNSLDPLLIYQAFWLVVLILAARASLLTVSSRFEHGLGGEDTIAAAMPCDSRSRQAADAWLNPWILLVCGLGVGWLLMMAWDPALATSESRAPVRMLLILVPTLVYVRGVERKPVLGTLGLVPIRPAGIALAATIALAHFGTLTATQWGRDGAARTWPWELSGFVGAVIAVPLAEEMFFRGIVFRVMARTHGAVSAAFGSAAVFALFHLPGWMMSGQFDEIGLIVNLLTLFVYGVLFAALYRLTHTLWAPIAYHAIGNFFVMGMNGIDI